ncbi:MAG: hypothetical protein WC069_02745 [Candidatus Shapirobacteria bacterium]
MSVVQMHEFSSGMFTQTALQQEYERAIAQLPELQSKAVAITDLIVQKQAKLGRTVEVNPIHIIFPADITGRHQYQQPSGAANLHGEYARKIPQSACRNILTVKDNRGISPKLYDVTIASLPVVWLKDDGHHEDPDVTNAGYTHETFLINPPIPRRFSFRPTGAAAQYPDFPTFNRRDAQKIADIVCRQIESGGSSFKYGPSNNSNEYVLGSGLEMWHNNASVVRRS